MKRPEVISDQRSVISDTAPSTMPKADNRKLTTSNGFTLVEVVLAIAVISIGIIAILGLLPNALQSGRDAADNTLAATVAQDTFNILRSYPFDAAVVCDTCAGTQNLATYNQTESNAYTQAGFSTNNWNGAYFKVVVNFQPQTPLQSTRVTAAVVWPAQSRVPANTNIFATIIAQYD